MTKPAHVTPKETPKRSWLTRAGIYISGFILDKLGNSSPGLEVEEKSASGGAAERGLRIASRIAISVAIGFFLFVAGVWGKVSITALIGGTLLVGATVYFFIFIFTRISIIKRAFATVATMSALSVASAGFGFSANIGALLVELGVVERDPGITLGQGALSWGSVVILIVINALLFLAVRAETRA